MRRDFKLAVLADPGTFINQIVRQFGDVSEVGADGWPDDSEAVIFDCAHPEIGRHRETWCRVLDGSKTLGLIGMQAEDRAVLEGIVGRPLKASIPSLFVRKFKGDPRGYRYTILPDVARVQAMQPAQVAEFLTAQVFTQNSQNPTIVGPPDPINNIWPLSSQFGEIRGTRKEMVVFSNGGGWGAPFPPNSGSNAALNAVGHFILANGRGGDGRYHAIILSRLSAVTPLAPDSDGNPYGFGLKLTASVGGNQLQYPAVNTNSTQPMATNTPAPLNWGYIGGFICTELAGVSITTRGTNAGSTTHTDCDVTPKFQEYRSQLTTPGIENFQVFQLDTPIKSEVQFTMWGSSATPPNSEREIKLVQLSPEGAAVPSVLALGDEDFVVVHHLDFADPGLPSYNVDFQFTLALYAVGSDGILYNTENQAVVTVDLVKATEMTTID